MNRSNKNNTPLQEGIVTYFNNEKGYGHINLLIYGKPTDTTYFVHFSAIRDKGMRFLEKGDHVKFRIGPGRKGDEVIDVWVIEPEQNKAQDEKAYSGHSSLLNNPKIWEEFDWLVKEMAKKGRSFSKVDLLEADQRGRCFLEAGIKAGQLAGIIQTLALTGEALTPEDLLDDKGRPNSLLQAIIKDEKVAELFCEQNWHSQSRQACRKVYDALPEEARAQVKNLHAIFATAGQPLHQLER